MTEQSEPDPISGLPIGPPVATHPAQRPGPVTLEGRYGRVERHDMRHAEDLWKAVEGNDAIWTYMSRSGPFETRDKFMAWMPGVVAAEDPYSYVVMDKSGRAVGMAALMDIKPVMRSVEVGHIVYSPAMQKTPLGTEVQYLLARYAFETLGYRRYEWKCNSLNAASRRAALRYGFVFEGILRHNIIAKGRSRDTAWFSMLEAEWPKHKAEFERWLAPDNFDADGRQKTRLGSNR